MFETERMPVVHPHCDPALAPSQLLFSQPLQLTRSMLFKVTPGICSSTACSSSLAGTGAQAAPPSICSPRKRIAVASSNAGCRCSSWLARQAGTLMVVTCCSTAVSDMLVVVVCATGGVHANMAASSGSTAVLLSAGNVNCRHEKIVPSKQASKQASSQNMCCDPVKSGMTCNTAPW
jgi:hypothetical protein